MVYCAAGCALGVVNGYSLLTAAGKDEGKAYDKKSGEEKAKGCGAGRNKDKPSYPG